MGIDLPAALHQHGDEIARLAAGGQLNLDQYDWLKVSLHSMMNPVRMTTDIRFVVRMETHTHYVGNVSFQPQRAEWVTGLAIADRELKYHRDPPEVLRLALDQIFRDVSPRLYEHDPRIGMFPPTSMPTNKDQPYQPLIRCPLFDPQSMFPRPDFGNNEYREPWTREQPPPPWVYGKCRFCGHDFDMNPPMWGGGNLLWVHQTCWMKVVGK